MWGNGGVLSNTLQNGDPNRTLYVSRARTDFLGSPAVAGSTGWSILNDNAMSGGANGIINQNNVLETQYAVARLRPRWNFEITTMNNPSSTGLRPWLSGLSRWRSRCCEVVLPLRLV